MLEREGKTIKPTANICAAHINRIMPTRDEKICPLSLTGPRREYCLREDCMAWDEEREECRLLRSRCKGGVASDGEWLELWGKGRE
jgi:hypothetical protein